MSEATPWRRLWRDVDVAMDRFRVAQAECMGRLLKDVRLAVSEYGRELDPDGFDELGQPIEPEPGILLIDGRRVDIRWKPDDAKKKDTYLNPGFWKKDMADVLDDITEVEE